MLQPRRRLDLGQEPLRAARGGGLRTRALHISFIYDKQSSAEWIPRPHRDTPQTETR